MTPRFFLVPIAAAVLFAGREAVALEILMTSIDDRGNLALDVAADPPPVSLLRFTARSRAIATYVCVNRFGSPHPDPNLQRIVTATLQTTAGLPVDVGGFIRGSMLLELPSESAPPLRCPRFYSATLASVVHTRIEVRDQLGQTAIARDISRLFVAP